MFICVKVGKQVFSKYTCFNRDFEKLTKDVEETKEKFADFEKQDVKCREDLKHAKGKTKKLEKTLEQEKKRVSVQVDHCKGKSEGWRGIEVCLNEWPGIVESHAGQCIAQLNVQEQGIMN